MKLLLVFAFAVVTVGLAVALPTLGDDPADGSRGDGAPVTQTVTRDFGTEVVDVSSFDDTASGETVMRLLQRDLEVETRYGGGFVQSVEGFAGGREDGRQVDWFFYVNGIESESGAAARSVSPGDRIWWDLHDWDTVMRVPAVVGSFPEPFKSGTGGKKLPVRLDCQGEERLCDEVTERLAQAGVTTIARSSIKREVGPDLLRIVVGPWEDMRVDVALRALEQPPAASGVYARFLDEGDRLALYDERGEVVRTLDDGAGLVAAVRAEGQQPAWVVTGTDAVGAAAAAGMLTEELLDRRFAVAVEDGRAVGLPVQITPGD